MKINISNFTYIVVLISFLAGFFEYVFLFLLIILIHEFGHLLFGCFLKLKNIEIILYPFGGITNYNCELNISIKKEFFCLIGGVLFQILFYILVIYLNNLDLLNASTYNKIHNIHIALLYFNFMPILPLDGGRIINIIFDKLFSYKLSYKLSILISIIFIIIFIFNNINIYGIILSIFLIKSIIIEIKSINIKYNKFLLERYLYKHEFNKLKIINNINNFKRDYYHIINNESETVFLSKLFDTKNTL